MPQWIKNIAQYIPVAWMTIKILWSLYRAKVKADGYKEAMKQQRELKIEAQRQLALERRRAATTAERRAIILAELAERERAERQSEGGD